MITDASGGPRLFAYATSHRIEAIGESLLRKDLSAGALIGDARNNRVERLDDPRREPAVYTRLLGPVGIGPRCLDAGDDWVLLERLDAVPLWQVGEPATWVAVARWMASMHARLPVAAAEGLSLVRHDAALGEWWRQRARRLRVPAHVVSAHERGCQRLAACEPVVIHGELYPSNVLVRDDDVSIGVWPIDWELAGIGPAVLDVAALTAGWPARSAVPLAMARAYFEAAAPPGSWDSWCDDLLAARLYISVQWLAWSRWTPPVQHRHDWMGEAMSLAELL